MAEKTEAPVVDWLAVVVSWEDQMFLYICIHQSDPNFTFLFGLLHETKFTFSSAEQNQPNLFIATSLIFFEWNFHPLKSHQESELSAPSPELSSHFGSTALKEAEKKEKFRRFRTIWTLLGVHRYGRWATHLNVETGFKLSGIVSSAIIVGEQVLCDTHPPTPQRRLRLSSELSGNWANIVTIVTLYVHQLDLLGCSCYYLTAHRGPRPLEWKHKICSSKTWTPLIVFVRMRGTNIQARLSLIRKWDEGVANHNHHHHPHDLNKWQ